MNAGLALITGAALILQTITGYAYVLCPACKGSISADGNSGELAQTINSAILVLLVPTLLIIGGLIGLVFKYVNFRSSDSQRDFE